MVARAENALWDRLVEPAWEDLPREAAEGILRLRFSEADLQRMNELAALARKGELTTEQRADLETYHQVGRMVAVLHSKARMVLQHRHGR